jgi:hypothetical protein
LGRARQLTEACGWECPPRYIVRDRDRVYGEFFTQRLRAMGIRDRPTAPQSPWQIGHTERLIGSIRRECLLCFHTELLERPVGRVLPVSFLGLSRPKWRVDRNADRPRAFLSLNKDALIPQAVQAVGRILPTPILGGLHHQ